MRCLLWNHSKLNDIVFNIADLLGRDAAHDAVIRNILCHHGPGGNDDIIANCYAGENRHISSDPYIVSNIDRFSTASIVTRLTTDVTNVQNAFQMVIRMAVRAPILLVFALFMSFLVNARLAVIYLCVIPVLGVGLFVIVKCAHPLFERVFKTYDRLNMVVQENLHGIRVVTSFVRSTRRRSSAGCRRAFTGISRRRSGRWLSTCP